jgi:hypothetical protein
MTDYIIKDSKFLITSSYNTLQVVDLNLLDNESKAISYVELPSYIYNSIIDLEEKPGGRILALGTDLTLLSKNVKEDRYEIEYTA